MKVIVDADACPVVGIVLELCRQYHCPCLLVCDTAHRVERDGAQTVIIDKGADSADFAIVNRSKNVTIKNVTVKCIDICNFQGKVVESSPEMVKIDLGENHPKLYRYGYALFEDIEHEKVPFTRTSFS